MRIVPVADVSPIQAATPAAVPETQAPVSRIPVRLLNPQPVIDPALGIVVTEYFNKAGQMTEQYPTAKAVETYRIYGLHNDPDDVASLKS